MTPDRWSRLQEQVEDECPYSRQPIHLRLWEWYLFVLVWDMLIVYGDGFRWRQPPPPIVCVDATGRPSMEGYAFGFRWAVEAREIQIAVAASRRAKYVRWWPLGRVWWVVEEG